MRELLVLAVLLCTAGCMSKDDALYAPWNSSKQVNAHDRESNLSKIVNNKLSTRKTEVEYCVTKLSHPFEQTCTKEEDL